MDGYKALAMGIIEQAAKDYKGHLRGRPAADSGSRESIEEFFRSGWFAILSHASIDGKKLLADIWEALGSQQRNM